MGFWHTGYIEFHEPTGLDTSYQPSEAWFACEKCSERFKTIESLRQHRFQQHPSLRPLLFVRGIEVGATAFRITKRLADDDVEFNRASTIVMNGASIKLSELASTLTKVTNDRVTLELANQEARAKFELLFEIASEEHINGVETAFLKMVRGRTLCIAAIEAFIEDCRKFSTAGHYYGGLCQYLYGVLAKERSSDSGLSFNEYQNKYNCAADALKGFERPLAKLVQALVAFHFNHFEDAQVLAPTGRLQFAASTFAQALYGHPWYPDACVQRDEPSALEEDLLTDHETLRVLRWAILSTRGLEKYTDDILAQTECDIPDVDRVKLLLLLGEGLAASGDVVGARRVARKLTNNDKTLVWAETLLTRLGKKDNEI